MNINDINGINEIKALALDMITTAGSGHPGIVLSAAPILYTLYTRHMNINPENPEWLNRDRLVLSAGHASALLYATLYLCGYPITKDDLKKFRRMDSKCPGFPEFGTTPGVDMTTIDNGEGLANAVGFALGERYIENLLNKEDDEQKLIDYRTYVLCSDADLMNGDTYEAASFAGTQKLDKLMILYDCTKVTNDGRIDTTFMEDVEMRFKAMGFYTDNIKNGMDLKSIDKAINNAKKSKKPAFLLFNTILGCDSRNENNNVVYNTPLTDDDIFAIKRKLNITIAPFEVRKDTFIHVSQLIKNRVTNKYNDFVTYFNKARSSGNEKMIEILRMVVNRNVVIPFDSVNYRVNGTYNEDIRLTNHKILNIVASRTDVLLGGSTDVASTTKAFIDNSSVQMNETPLGRNINFGLRNHAMGGILNGMAMLGLKVYGNTKLIFSDQLKSSMRISAMLNLPVTYIFTHDSILTVEDGALYQPVEQLAMLRSIPGMITFRPCDISEIFGVWEYISKNNKTVSVLINPKVMPKIPTSNALGVKNGAYIIKKEKEKVDGIIIATGPEVLTAIHIAEELLEQHNLDIRVVSMPSQELFLQTEKEYQKQILPDIYKTIVIEPSSKMSWGFFVKDEKYVLGINDYGYSGNSQEVAKKCEYDYESLKLKVITLLLND